MTSQPGKQTIAISILLDISRSKDNQTMKFSQSIEHNLKDISLEKSYIKYDRETIPRPFCNKNKIGHISGSIILLHVKLRTIDIY